MRKIIILLLSFLSEIAFAGAAAGNAGTLSFDLSPTAQLGVSPDVHRRLLSKSKEWKYRHGVYGAMEYYANHDSLLKEEFDASRHLSRFERNIENGKRSLNSNQFNEDDISDLNSPNASPYQLVPLFQGYGTHYSSVWVGTPPQRKSVIVDTGSHYTAFPCEGCENCGEEHHTDPYFDPAKSSTFHALSCDECESPTCNRDGTCVFTQSYTEGSSWSAYQVRDRFFCGNSYDPEDPIHNSYAIEFMFGCQTSESGLFVTQLADGIMGMSAHPATYPNRLFEEGKIKRNVFTLCFKRELSVSKEGIHAGVMTFGGVDTRLNSSPMVYAKNTAKSGWYTVNVKNIYLRKGGGHSSKLDAQGSEQKDIIHLPMNKKAVNSGKGVIVDSGTTDTYLSQSLRKPFYEVWQAITGMAYSNSAIKLSREEIQKLPTLLIQLEAFVGMGNKELMSMEQRIGGVVGLVGSLDVTSPQDVLLAVPAEHFFEYSPSRDTYTSRLYFTESSGGVLGANAMLGHDVLFDWDYGRIGFAESSCEYADIAPDAQIRPGEILVNEGQPPEPANNKDTTANRDCVMSPPGISQTCIESIDKALDICAGMDPNMLLEDAIQTSIFVIHDFGSESGKSCQLVAMEMADGRGPVSCSENGVCTLIETCKLRCKDVAQQSQADNLNGDIVGDNCDEGSWSPCSSDCVQSKVQSKRLKNGSCGKGEKETRACHVDFCGSIDPCRVPFVVHVIVGLGGVNPALWSKRYDELFAEVFASNLEGIGDVGPGDIDIIMTKPWDDKNEVELKQNRQDLGLKLILEISIFREAAPLGNFGIAEAKTSSTSCGVGTISPFAMVALEIQNALQHENFIPRLLDRLISSQTEQTRTTTPFDFANNVDSFHLSRIVSSWTIQTDQGSVYEHVQESKKSSLTSANMPNTLSSPIVLMVILCLGVFAFSFAYKRKSKRAYDKIHVTESHPVGFVTRQKYNVNDSKGRYSEIGSDGDLQLA